MFQGRKLLVLSPSEAVRDELSTVEALPKFEDLRDGVWLVANLETLLDNPDEPRRIARAAKLSGTLILLSKVRVIESAPEPLRAEWARALEEFEVVSLTATSTPGSKLGGLAHLRLGSDCLALLARLHPGRAPHARAACAGRLRQSP